MNGIHPAREVLAIAGQTRALGHTPSIFIDDYYVNGAEQCFEEWLYRNDFRPAWDNFLGKTILLVGLDADTLNEYFYDREHGFQRDRDKSKNSWTWGNVAAFAFRIKQIKKLVRN